MAVVAIRRWRQQASLKVHLLLTAIWMNTSDQVFAHRIWIYTGERMLISWVNTTNGAKMHADNNQINARKKQLHIQGMKINTVAKFKYRWTESVYVCGVGSIG